jgi:hypothetical protein
MTDEITQRHVDNCLKSAYLWEEELPRYANLNQRHADAFSTAAGLLSALTGLSAWTLLTNLPGWPAQLLVGFVSLAAAACALVPRVRNFAEEAGLARELASQYGRFIGDLTDLQETQVTDQARARRVIEAFQITKEKKDSLRGLRNRAIIEIEQADEQARIAQAQEGAALATEKMAAAEKDAKLATPDTQPPPGSAAAPGTPPPAS